MSYNRIIFLALAVLLVSCSASRQLVLNKKINGSPCHGGNVFNDEPLTDFADLAATFENQAHASFWTDSPIFLATGQPSAPFNVRELGAIVDGVAEFITEDTPEDALIATKSSPEAAFLFGYDPNDPEFAGRFDQPWSEIETFTNIDFELTDIDYVSPTNTGQYAPAEVNRPTLTVGEWNKVRGDVRVKCYEEDDGSLTGHITYTLKHAIPDMAYTIWCVSAGTKNDSPAPIYATMMGGMPALIVTDNDGFATFDRELAFCPLNAETPVMYTAFAAHPTNIIWGSQVFSPDTFFPLGGSDHLCFSLGDDASNYIF